MTQGFHGVATWLLGVLVGLSSHAIAQAGSHCPGPHLHWDQVAPQVYWIQGAAGEPDATNRGATSNQLVARQGSRVWLMGSGPSPQAGQALACQLRQRLGWRVTDVINPWARPELVLGNRAFASARLWAHVEVARAMREHCPQCEERLRLRLGPAGDDLGTDPIRAAKHLLQGDTGSLGPFRWWRLERATGVTVTVWRLQSAPLWLAPGLLWGDGPPDLRDADAITLLTSTDRLTTLAANDGSAARWSPEQGPWLGSSAPAAHATYLRALIAAVQQRQQAGEQETAPPPALPGWTGWQAGHPHGVMNWQRAWRRLEEDSFLPAPPPQAPR